MIRSLHTLWWPLEAIGGIQTGLKHLIRIPPEKLGVKMEVIHGGDLPKSNRIFVALLSLGKRDLYRVKKMRKDLELAKPIIAETANRFKAHVIHSEDVYSAYSSLEITLPLVVHVHGLALEEAMSSGIAKPGNAVHALISLIEHSVFERADAVIAVSESVKRSLINKGVRPSKIWVIHNGTDAQWLQKISEKHPSPFEFPYVFTARRLVPKNGVDILVKAFARVAKIRNDLRLVIAGDGPQKRQIIELAENLGLKGRVLFLGSVPYERIPGLTRKALVTVIPSIPSKGVEEPFGHVAIEAMALRVPVIASAVGGLVEVVTHGETGILVPPGEPEALAEAIEHLVLSPKLRLKFGEAGAKKVEADYSPEAWLAKIKRVYEEIL